MAGATTRILNVVLYAMGTMIAFASTPSPPPTPPPAVQVECATGECQNYANSTPGDLLTRPRVWGLGLASSAALLSSLGVVVLFLIAVAFVCYLRMTGKVAPAVEVEK